MPDWAGDGAVGAAAGGLTLALTLAGVLSRILYMELRGRIERAEQALRRQIEAAEVALRLRVERAEGRIDEVHLRFARRDDIARELEGIRQAFAEVFAELRRANEGIAALSARVAVHATAQRRGAGAGGESAAS